MMLCLNKRASPVADEGKVGLRLDGKTRWAKNDSQAFLLEKLLHGRQGINELIRALGNRSGIPPDSLEHNFTLAEFVLDFSDYIEQWKHASIAVCSPFLLGDTWAERLQAALPAMELTIETCCDTDTLLQWCRTTRYDAAVIDYQGDAGHDAVRRVREISKKQPIIWISNSDEDGVLGYQYRVSWVLPRDAAAGKLRDALARCFEKGL